MKSTLLFYRKLWTDLLKKGFKLNLYDPYVANKMVNSKQMSIFCHIDDLMMFHPEEDVLTEFIDYTKGVYRELSVSRGDVHNYLGMRFDFSDRGKVGITMSTLAKEVIEELIATAKDPAGSHLLDVRDEKSRVILPGE